MITEIFSLNCVSFASIKLRIIATSMLLTAGQMACSTEKGNDENKINKN